MDDGTYVKDRGVRLATNSYTFDEVQILGKLLRNKFNLTTSIHSDNTLYIKKISLPQLRLLVQPFMINSMLYKLGYII